MWPPGDIFFFFFLIAWDKQKQMAALKGNLFSDFRCEHLGTSYQPQAVTLRCHHYCEKQLSSLFCETIISKRKSHQTIRALVLNISGWQSVFSPYSQINSQIIRWTKNIEDSRFDRCFRSWSVWMTPWSAQSKISPIPKPAQQIFGYFWIFEYLDICIRDACRKKNVCFL